MNEDKYFITNRNTTSPLTIEEVANFLRIDVPTGGSQEETELQCLIDACVLWFENWSNYYIVETSFQTLRASWCISELKKAPYKSLESVKYFDTDGVEQTLDPSKYEEIKSTLYYSIRIKEYENLSTEISYPVLIDFTVGLVNDTENNLPIDLKIALLQHINLLYSNRGDCPNGSCNLECYLPPSARSIYEHYRINEILG